MSNDRVIYKYELTTTDIELPEGSVIRHFGEDGAGKLCVWAEHDYPVPDKVSRRFVIFGTGWVMRSEIETEFIATTVESTGLVWHLFEVKS